MHVVSTLEVAKVCSPVHVKTCIQRPLFEAEKSALVKNCLLDQVCLQVFEQMVRLWLQQNIEKKGMATLAAERKHWTIMGLSSSGICHWRTQFQSHWKERKLLNALKMSNVMESENIC